VLTGRLFTTFQVLVRTTRIAELTSEKSTLEKAGLEKDDTIRGLVEEKNERADRMANVVRTTGRDAAWPRPSRRLKDRTATCPAP
jgi:hypothetical protein